MADKMDNTEHSAYRSTLLPRFDLNRTFCMDGTYASDTDKRNKQFTQTEPVRWGEACMLGLEHSADTERHPAALKARPDKALLAPFKLIAEDKGFSASDASAAQTVELFSRMARTPAAQETIGPGRHVLEGGNGKPFVLVPGVAWDAGFTKTVRDAHNGTAQPLPRMSRAQLVQEAQKCFTNAQQYIGACYADGVEHAREYLARRNRLVER